MEPAAPPTVVSLEDPRATDADLVGAKAANLAAARAAGLPTLPGVVLTTSWDCRATAEAIAAWRTVSEGGTRAVVVRSSSTGEDGDASSMAGVFESILDVVGESGLVAAIDQVHASAVRARRDGLVDAAMAVLVQPMLRPAWGGVLFGADPLTGRRDRFVVAAVPGGPDQLVSGAVDGWTGVLGRRGRVVDVRSAGDAPRPPERVLRRLVALAQHAERAFGGPQDIEWAVDTDGHLHLLQARPITALPPMTGPVYGPGPVAESFPDPLSALEQDLWLDPLRDGLREALLLTGTSTTRSVRSSDLVVTVDGVAAVDLAMIGAEAPRRGVLRRFDPRPPARRLRAAWRVGRLRSALPELALDLVAQIDDDLGAVPPLATLGDDELLALLANGRRSLVSLHGHEALVGLLIPSTSTAAVTGASMALEAIGRARADGLTVDELVEARPVVLALVPPRIGGGSDALADLLATAPTTPVTGEELPEQAAIAREALRLRIRWLQELMARAAWEVGARLARTGSLRAADDVRHLRLEQLDAAVRRRITLVPSIGRTSTSERHLPTRFRLDANGRAWAAPPVAGRRRARGGADHAATGAGGGTATAPVHLHRPDVEVPAGHVLVVTHLDPRLAAVIPRLAGLVAETGSPLSHLAILAREHGVPTVVGMADATARLTDGDVVTVDGHLGTVTAVDATREDEAVAA